MLISNIKSRYSIPEGIISMEALDLEFMQYSELQYSFISEITERTHVIFVNFDNEIHGINIGLSSIEHLTKLKN